MLVNWNYKERNTIVQRLDPRARVIFILCAIVAIILVWDLRVLVLWLAFSLLTLRLARLTWAEMRRFWLVVLPVVTFLVTLTALTGRGGEEAYRERHLNWQATWTLFGRSLSPSLSIEQLFFAASQFSRMLSMAALSLLIPFTIHPAQYGVTFKGLGLSDKFAVATDLAFRFVPTLGRDFATVLDAQRARGYEVERLGGGLVQQVRNLAPLIIPITIGAILGAEDIIDAMDLRAFGTRPKRTWVTQLVYRRKDYVLIAVGVTILVLTIILRRLGIIAFWVPLGWL
ncbi:MAG: energy-coupling factor transporter transmembrane protein EcfT [Caldilineales bacterium]|nr:energy-coupling factor transporter transmembrane protein EcfT [Caldilineales bacterium]